MYGRPSSGELDSLLALASRAARDAGRLILSSTFNIVKVRKEKSPGDVVTETDLASEELIINHIRRAYPNHQIISEERGLVHGNEPWTWLIDPLDGSNNLALGLPAYAVGITIFWELTPMAAVIHDPLSRCTWSAVVGRGVSANGKSVQTGRLSPPRRIAAWTQGYSVARDCVPAYAYRLALEHHCVRLIQLWAPLPCWIMLIQGRIDVIIGFQVGKIDLFPGVLLAIEAGLDVRNLDGSPFSGRLDIESVSAEDRDFIAGRHGIVEELLESMPSAVQIISPQVPRLLSGLRTQVDRETTS